MTCEDLDDRIEPWAEGEATPSPEEAAHLQACARCTRALTLARRLERALADPAAIAMPPRFTEGVMARVSTDRWQREERVDRVFNGVLAAGLAVVVAAIGYALQLSGVVAVISRAAGEVDTVWRESVGMIPVEPILYAVATLAGIATLALWRRREGDELF